MFDSIKTALNQSSQSSTNVRADILKFTPDNQYDLRLVPNVKDPGKTFFHYYNQSWTSFSTGQFVSSMSPQTFGETCPIATVKFRLKNTGTEEEKQKADTIRRSENWLVNVYVINDPSNPDNNGTVKIMRFGKQLHKIIMDSIQDEDEAAVGFRAFDLTSSGCNFRVKVDRQGEFPSYVTSKFLLPSEVKGLEDVDAVLEGVFELDTVFARKSDEEMGKMLDEHFYCGSNNSKPVVDKDLEEEVPMNFPTKTEPAATEAKPDSAQAADDGDGDEILDKLLAGLDD